jgi:hypothetical protein
MIYKPTVRKDRTVGFRKNEGVTKCHGFIMVQVMDYFFSITLAKMTNSIIAIANSAPKMYVNVMFV